MRELYAPFVEKITALYARIDQNAAAISDLNGCAPKGESTRLIDDAELAARGLQSYNADQPRLRENLKLPDWTAPREIAYPAPPSNLVALAMIAAAQAVERKQSIGPDWAASKQLADEQAREEMAQRRAAQAEWDAEEKRAYERAVQENDRKRRLGITASEEM